MADSVQKDIQISRDLEKKLSAQLAKGDVSLALIAESLEAIRSSSESAILADFNVAATSHTEDRLWSAHQRVNTYFRTALSQLQKQPNQFVTFRKIRMDYVRFIKSSQKFYRGFVRHLSEAYGGIPKLQRVAQALNRDRSGSVTPKSAATVTELAILRSCHRTLIQLGDLSRYRETEVGEEKRDWSPAIGFYDLAGSILPNSGQSHNQLAVLALAEGNIFRAVYHLYRSLSSEEPHPQSEGNLKKAFSKISSSWEKGELVEGDDGSKTRTSHEALLGWYLRLLELCHQGKGQSQPELEDEVFGRFATLLKQDASSTLHRIVVVNIASADAAQKRFQSAAASSGFAESYLSFLRLNLRCFVAMLDQLRTELDDLLMRAHAGKRPEAKILVSQLSSSAARILPQLRIYNAWLRKNVLVVANFADDSSSNLHRHFWSTYAHSLSAMAEAFPADSLPDLSYMLEEDVDTIGFQPLHGAANRSTWYEGDILRTAPHEIKTTERVTSTEMLFRIRGILIIGLETAFNPQSPLKFDQDQYCFRFEPESGQNDAVKLVKCREQRQHAQMDSNTVPTSLARTDSHDMDTDAHRMVDSLVDLKSDNPQPSNTTQECIMVKGSDDFSTLPPVDKSVLPSPGAAQSSNLRLNPGAILANQRGLSISPTDQSVDHKGSDGLSRGHPPAALHPTTTRGSNYSAGYQHDPVTPKQVNQFPRLSSTSRVSPFAPPGLSGHNRNLSTESTHSRSSIWTPEEAWNRQSVGDGSLGIAGLVNLGNGSFGTDQRHEIPGDYGMGSSLLFGAGTSPWNMSARESRNLSESPRIASIWDVPSGLRQTQGRPFS